MHPVFYQGTYSQVLNDAKRELKFLLIYLHNDDSVDTADFCRQVISHFFLVTYLFLTFLFRNILSQPQVITYVNTNFFFWACGIKSGEGNRVAQLYKTSHYPYLAVVVLKDSRMTIVSRMEGFCDANTLIQRLSSVVAEYEINLVQARADR